MNMLKRFLAMALCLALVLTCFTGCHEKGEIAVTVGDVQFTSGYYACALVFADMEARNKLITTLDASVLYAENFEYHKQQIDGQDYTTWVENNALDKLKLIAAAKQLCAESNITPSDEVKTSYDFYVDSFWADEQFVSIMEKNGVAKETFREFLYDYYMVDNTLFEAFFAFEQDPELVNPLFDSIYGEGGSKAIANDKVKEHLNGNYVLVNMLSADTSSKTAEEKAELEKQFAAYEKELKDGTKTFEQVYNDYNKIEETKEEKEETTDSEATDDTPVAQDEFGIVLRHEDNETPLGYTFEKYDTIKAMAVGEIKTITLEEDGGIILVIRKDILEDPFYFDVGYYELIREMVGDEFTNTIKERANSLNCDVNKKSTRQFKVKKIYYPDTMY